MPAFLPREHAAGSAAGDELSTKFSERRTYRTGSAYSDLSEKLRHNRAVVHLQGQNLQDAMTVKTATWR